MNRAVQVNILRAIGIFLIQVFVLRMVQIEGLDYVYLLVYPLFILLLPIRTPVWVLLLLAFGFGLGIDSIYHSLGVHASALVFTAFMRAGILRVLEPRGGYNSINSPNIRTLGIAWFARYSGSLLFLHLLFYFSIEVFTPALILDILFKTVSSFVFSLAVLLLLVWIGRPKT